MTLITPWHQHNGDFGY